MALNNPPGYVATLVTLTSASSSYNLYSLVKAVSGKENTKPECRGYFLQASDANGSPILIGDADMSDTAYGSALNSGDAQASPVSPCNNSYFGLIYARSTAAGQVVGIQLFYV